MKYTAEMITAMKRREVADLLYTIIFEVAGGSQYDQEIVLDEITQIMSLCNYPEELILEFYYLVEKFFHNPEIEFRTVPETIVKLPPSNQKFYMSELLAFKTRLAGKPTKKEVKFRRGIIYEQEIAEEKRTEGFIKQGHKRPQLNAPCIIMDNGEHHGETGTLLRLTRDGIAIVDIEGKTIRVHPESIVVYDNEISNTSRVSKYYDAVPVPIIEDKEVKIMHHSYFGPVKILGETTDKYGQKIYIIVPTTDDIFDNTSGNFYVDDDEVGESKRLTMSKKLIECYPCELEPIESMRKDVLDSIAKIRAGSATSYQIYSASDYANPELRYTTEVMQHAKYQDDSPTARSIGEDVYVLAELPREKIYTGTKKPKIEILETTDKIVVDGVIRYVATNMVVQNEQCMFSEGPLKVLVQGVDTGRLFIANASTLYKTEVPETKDLTLQLYEKKKVKTVKTGEKKVALDLGRKEIDGKIIYNNPEHKRLFDITSTRQDLRYVPVKKEEQLLRQFRVALQKRPQMEELISSINSLNLDNFKLDKQKDGVKVTVFRGNNSWDFMVIKKADKYIADTQLKISDKAKELFAELVSCMC